MSRLVLHMVQYIYVTFIHFIQQSYFWLERDNLPYHLFELCKSFQTNYSSNKWSDTKTWYWRCIFIVVSICWIYWSCWLHIHKHIVYYQLLNQNINCDKLFKTNNIVNISTDCNTCHLCLISSKIFNFNEKDIESFQSRTKHVWKFNGDCVNGSTNSLNQSHTNKLYQFVCDRYEPLFVSLTRTGNIYRHLKENWKLFLSWMIAKIYNF